MSKILLDPLRSSFEMECYDGISAKREVCQLSPHSRDSLPVQKWSFFRRHIPVWGYDFVNNKKAFFKNGYAQVSDLLTNAYELYYLKNKKRKLNEKERSRKILSRIYEAVSYMCLIDKNDALKELRKKIVIYIAKQPFLKQSKAIFNEVVLVYQNKIKNYAKNKIIEN